MVVAELLAATLLAACTTAPIEVKRDPVDDSFHVEVRTSPEKMDVLIDGVRAPERTPCAAQLPYKAVDVTRETYTWFLLPVFRWGTRTWTTREDHSPSAWTVGVEAAKRREGHEVYNFRRRTEIVRIHEVNHPGEERVLTFAMDGTVDREYGLNLPPLFDAVTVRRAGGDETPIKVEHGDAGRAMLRFSYRKGQCADRYQFRVLRRNFQSDVTDWIGVNRSTDFPILLPMPTIVDPDSLVTEPK